MESWSCWHSLCYGDGSVFLQITGCSLRESGAGVLLHQRNVPKKKPKNHKIPAKPNPCKVKIKGRDQNQNSFVQLKFRILPEREI